MRVGLLLKLHKPEAVEIARELLSVLAVRGVESCVAGAPPGSLPEAHHVGDERLPEVKMLVVLGGDGTLLHGAELVADEGVPILGINLGNLGFLTSCPTTEARPALEAALDGKLVIERRMRLRVVLTRADGQKPGEQVVRYACNDVVISQGAIARLIEFEAFLDGKPISTYRADGLIIATPTGSTAYNLAAGGPILTPELQGMVLSPICPHTLTNRPLVVPAASRLTVQLGEAAKDVMLTVDGQWATPLTEHDRVVVHAAHRPMLLYSTGDTTFFDILRTKLHWGERVGVRVHEPRNVSEAAAPTGATSPPPRR